jgi:copper homeostasis protein (lipoprotein)
MKRRLAAMALEATVFALLFSQPAATQQNAAPAKKQPAAEQLVKPQSLYVGEIPCADCQGIVYEVDLRDRNIFFLRVTYRGKDPATTRYDFGRWLLNGSQLTLQVFGARESREILGVQDANTLIKLDSAGKPIASTLNYTLIRQQAYTPLEPKLALQGMYSYHPEGETFTECRTGISVPVAVEGQHTDLRAAYNVARKEPGKFVFVEMDGRIVLRADASGANKQSTLVVDKMGKFFALRTCEVSGVNHEIETTRWVPATLGSAPVTLGQQQREPFIVFQTNEHRVTGFAGCNQLSGTYQLNGEQLKFSQTAATRMACAQGMDIEQRLLKALEATATWRIDGDRLQLRDSQGDVVANFKALNL